MNWKLLSLAALGFVLTGCDGKKEEKKADEPKPMETAPAVLGTEEHKGHEAKPTEHSTPTEAPTEAPAELEEKKAE
jgi:hypothetical protein